MILILKGMLIGVGKIIPGVSGSVIAINLGVYEKAISSLTNFFCDVKKNIKYLSCLCIGVIISISLLSKWIVYLLDNYYILTMSLFIGFIIGSCGIRKEDNSKLNCLTIFTFIVILFLSLISINNSIKFDNKYLEFIYMIFIGIIEAATMIIPGLSGTAVLMMVGAYNYIIQIYSNIFNIQMFLNNISVIVPLFIGIIIGIYLISKLINYLFLNHKLLTQKIINGFIYGSIAYMIISVWRRITSVYDIILVVVICLISIVIIKKIKVN